MTKSVRMRMPIPGLDDVLYVSTVTGIASLWLASLEGSPRQLTNVGYGADDSQLDPVYGDQVLWIDAYRIVFTASYASDVLWAFDVRTMSLVEVGPGAHPALGEHGELLSGGAFESETCTSYEIGGGA